MFSLMLLLNTLKLINQKYLYKENEPMLLKEYNNIIKLKRLAVGKFKI